MRILFLSWLLFSTFQIVHSQSFSEISEPSKAHHRVAGTDVYLIPPQGFKQNNLVKGFINPDNPNSILTIMQLEASFQQMKEVFKPDVLTQQGMKVLSQDTLSLYGYEGVIYELEQKTKLAGGLKFQMILGDESMTLFINASVGGKETDAFGQLKESIQTLYIDKEGKVDPRDALDYDLDESVVGYSMINMIGEQGMLFSTNVEEMIEESKSNSVGMLLTNHVYETPATDDLRLFSVKLLVEQPQKYGLIDEKSIQAFDTNGLEGFALTAAQRKNENQRAHFVVVFEPGGGYYTMLGMYDAAYPELLEEIKQLILTFERKK